MSPASDIKPVVVAKLKRLPSQIQTVAKSGTLITVSGITAMFYMLFFIFFHFFDYLSVKWDRKEVTKDKNCKELQVFYDPICSKADSRFPLSMYFHELSYQATPKFKVSKIPYLCFVFKGLYTHVSRVTDDRGVVYLKSQIKTAGSLYMVQKGEKFKIEIPKDAGKCWRIIFPLSWMKALPIDETSVEPVEKKVGYHLTDEVDPLAMKLD